jgi:hypothetical protein
MGLPGAVDQNQPTARWKTKTPISGLTRSTTVWQGGFKYFQMIQIDLNYGFYY